MATISSEQVRQLEILVSNQYVELFNAYPQVVAVYRKWGGKTPFTIQQLYNQQNPRRQIVDCDSIARLMTLHSYATGETIPDGCVLLDEEFGVLVVIGRFLGAIR